MRWNLEFCDAVSGIAGVRVFDRVEPGVVPYVLIKTMSLKRGGKVTTRSYFSDRDAALRAAKKFLADRSAMFGKEYKPSTGFGMWGYPPVNMGVKS